MESCPKPQPQRQLMRNHLCWSATRAFASPRFSAPGAPFEDSGEVTLASADCHRVSSVTSSCATVFPYVAGVCCGVCVGLSNQRNLGNMTVFSRCVLVLQEMGENPVSWALLWGCRILNFENLPLIARVSRRFWA